jgi:thioredoxin reductase (NADPH)
MQQMLQIRGAQLPRRTQRNRHDDVTMQRAGPVRASDTLPRMSDVLPGHREARDGKHPEIVDVMIVGGGPTGLATAYYAGHRDASVRIVDTLPELGGQVMAVYPEKHIFDVAGHPKIKASELIRLQVEQAMQFNPELVLGINCETLDYVDAPEGDSVEQLLRLTADDGRQLLARTLIITAGHGAFEPRKLPIEGIDEWEGRGLHYFVKRPDDFAGKRLVLVGGGDSALDWTLGLHKESAGPLNLVHRRDRFRAIESSVTHMRALVDQGAVRLHVPAEVTALHGNGKLEAVTVTDADSGEEQRVDCDALVTLLGFKSALGAIANWGLEFAGRKTIKVTPTMETNLPNVFAAGDVAHYDGKITLITIGMGEAAIAANWAVTKFRPEAKVQPKYSTE